MLETIYQNIIDGDRNETVKGVSQALENGTDPAEILNKAMIPAMQEVGRRFEVGDYYVPEMLIAARAMKEGLALLKPRLVQNDIQPTGTVVIGTVRGDLHDIGKNLVGIMLEGAGFEVVDLGTDVAPEKFVEAVQNHTPDLLAMSALLTTTMPGMQQTIQALREAGLRDRVRVIVGGAPVTESYARQVEADGYAPDASRAVALAKSFL